jgi:hypothetical protein
LCTYTSEREREREREKQRERERKRGNIMNRFRHVQIPSSLTKSLLPLSASLTFFRACGVRMCAIERERERERESETKHDEQMQT